MLRDARRQLQETLSAWNEHETPRLGAALSFYTILSLAPLIILVMAVVAFAFERSSAQDQILNQVQGLIGKGGADAVRTMTENAQKSSSGLTASVLGVITLLLGASGVFEELRSALNKIWDVKPKGGGGIREMIRQRLFSFGMVLAIGFLLLVSLLLNAALAMLGKFGGELLPIPEWALSVMSLISSFLVIAGVFALILKYVPETKIAWRDVRLGALVTAFLFTIGKFLIGLYLGKVAVGSQYGAAGSLIVIVVWVYYSSQVFFFGAEFTRVLANPRRAPDLRGRI